MTDETFSLLKSLAPSLPTIAGVIAGSIITFLGARKQFKASAISANRQQWINTLRDSIAELLTKAHISVFEASLAQDPRTEAAVDSKGHYESLKAMRLMLNKISLLINPLENDHTNLLKSLQQLEDYCLSGNPHERQEYNRLQETIISSAQKILKREWERVKRGR